MKSALMTRKEVMSCLDYKTVAGFQRFLTKYDDFPPVFRRSNSLNARVLYVRAEVKAWLANHGLADALA